MVDDRLGRLLGQPIRRRRQPRTDRRFDRASDDEDSYLGSTQQQQQLVHPGTIDNNKDSQDT